jgi:hypothetical protein
MSKEPNRSFWIVGLEKADRTPRCGARRKFDGTPCRKAAMANGRCDMHGGNSTGPRTREGLARRWPPHATRLGRFRGLAKPSDRTSSGWRWIGA